MKKFVSPVDLIGKNRFKKLAAGLTAASLTVFVLAAVINGLLSLKDRLDSVSPFLGTCFGCLMLFCFFFGIVLPVISVLRKPIFSLYMLRDKKGHARQYWCRRLVRNLIQNTDISEEEKNALPSFLSNGDETDDILIAFFREKMEPSVDACILAAAKNAFILTAVSQTSSYDMLSMLSVNFRQIRSIAEACGFRPGTMTLLALYIRIMKSALIAGGLEEMDLEDLLPLLTGNAAMKLPGIIAASAAQGTINAYTTIRVGILTKKFLFSENGPVCMKQARKESYAEALKLLKDSGLSKELFRMLSKKAGSAVSNAVSQVKKAGSAVKQNFLHAESSPSEE